MKTNKKNLGKINTQSQRCSVTLINVCDKVCKTITRNMKQVLDDWLMR